MKARLPQGYGGGPGNMNSMIRQAQKMQEEIERVTAELEVKAYTATVGGGAVTATVTGKMQVQSVTMQPEVVDPDDIEMLGDLVTAAVNEALRQASEEKSSRLDGLTSGLNMPGLF